jgi:hypothetical protein
MIDLNELPPDLARTQGGFDQKKALAQLLMQKAMAPQQGQMISGHYVGGGLAGALAPLVQAYMGKKLQGEADQGYSEVAGKYNERLAKGLEDYSRTFSGSPGTQQQTLEPDQPGPEMVDGFAKADPHLANVNAVGSGLRPLHDIGMAGLKAKFAPKAATPEKFSHPPVEVRGPDGKPLLVLIGDYGTRLPLSEFTPKKTFMKVADRVVDNDDPTQVVADYRKQFTNPYLIGPNLYQKETGTNEVEPLNKAPQTNISVGGAQITNKGETKFSETLGTGRAKNFLEAETNAQTAHRTLGSVAQLRELEAKGITSGKFSKPAGAIAEVAVSLGLPVDTNKLANTQGYDQQVARQVASVLTQGGGVGRSMTDADREAFLASLPSRLLTPQGRQQVYSQMERDAHSDIQHYRGLQQTLQENPTYKDSAGMLTVDPVGTPGAQIAPAGNVPPVGGRASGGAKPKTIIKGW